MSDNSRKKIGEEICMTSRRAKIGLGYHLAAFAAVNAVLVWINLDTSPEYFWAKWPLAGWAVALSYHAFSVFSSLIKAHKGFYYHLFSFLIINAFLIFINFDLSPQYLWFKFPLIVWTIMIVFHGWRVFSKRQKAKAIAA
jgi:hypothetical protein